MNNSSEILHHYEEISLCREDILFRLKELLDDFHGHDLPISYYDLIASDWLEPFSHILFTRYQKSITRKLKSGKVSVPAVYIGYDDLRIIVSNEKSYENLREIISQSLYYDETQLEYGFDFEQERVALSLGRKKSLTNLFFDFVRTSSPKVLITSPYFKCSKIDWMKAVWLWRSWAAWDEINFPMSIEVDVDVKWRNARFSSYNNGLPPKNFCDLVCKLLPLFIPVSLLEGFQDIRQAVLDIPIKRVQVMYSANALYGNIQWKILAAEWRMLGTKILYHQHGGGYGVNYRHLLEEYERRVSDIYYSWGWGNGEKDDIRTLTPSIEKCTKFKRKWVMLMCTDVPKIDASLPSFRPMPGVSENRLRTETHKFLKILGDTPNLVIRPYMHSYGKDTLKEYQELAPNAIINKNNSIIRFYCSCKVVFHNYVDTSWLETMSLNIPTICFYDPSIYYFRDDAKPYIEDLIQVNILHHSAESAAEFFKSTPDINTWWNSQNLQKKVKSFVKKYANFSEDWKISWEREFKSVLGE